MRYSRRLQIAEENPPHAAAGSLQRQTTVENVRNAFEVAHPENIKGKRIVLIDDVFTTGSTLKECAKVLKKQGQNLLTL